MANLELRKAWAETIAPEDYEQHMAAIGQAEANAHLVRDMLAKHPLEPGSTLLIAGAGPGQMFDYVSPEFLKPYSVTFTDISPTFLDRLNSRLAKADLKKSILLDDIECSGVRPIGGAVIVLVLEHVHWRKALRSLIENGARRLYLVMQVNPEGMASAVAPTRVLPGTLAAISPEAKPELVSFKQLNSYLGNFKFRCLEQTRASVADGKTMLGLVFDSVETF